MKENRKPKAKTKRGADAPEKAQAANPSGGKPSAPVAPESPQGKPEADAAKLSATDDFRWFEEDGGELLKMGAANFTRWKKAAMVLTYGMKAAIEANAGYAEILDSPLTLRAVECLISDPPEIADEMLKPNPNPLTGAASKTGRDWVLSTFRELYELPQNAQLDLSGFRFSMFPLCFNDGVAMLRQTFAKFLIKCGLPEFDGWRELLEADEKRTGRHYPQMGDFYETRYSEEQWTDLQTGVVNVPKYGGGGIRANGLLLGVCQYLRKRQGVADAPEKTQAANPSGERLPEGITGVAGQWASKQGITGYNGKRFYFEGECFEQGNKGVLWRYLQAIIESREDDGAAQLPANWRGRFSNVKNKWQMLINHIHPLENRDGAGWVHISRYVKNIKGGRKRGRTA